MRPCAYPPDPRRIALPGTGMAGVGHLLLAVILAFAPLTAAASPLDRHLAQAEPRGAATFRFLGLPVYEARLFTSQGAAFDWSSEFGLELRYLRSLRARALVDGTLQEMERIGTPAPSRAALERCFSDVGRGDRYLAVTQGPDRLSVYREGQRTCTLNHPGIKRGFMGIFLGENTRSASFTRALRGP